ncbi:CsgG/HfaB family protein, partial [Roseisolibacter sp. H3M3-2]|uniref:CsgG/HfaB family protein n=1 Tax=Roseisolibacter sp. H3M3-2 TaxID=3031323 RepID=UPI0023DB1B6B
AASPDVGVAVARERTQAGALAPGAVLGIPPFAVAAADTALAPLGYALADLLATDLSRSSRVTLVERTRLGEVLRELDLAAAGRVDSATAPRVGRILQAQRLLVGSVGTLGDANTLRLGVRVADVQSGALATTIDAQAPLADVLAAEKALALRLFDALGIVLTPAERRVVEERPTRNLAALLAYGRGVQRQLDGDFRGAVDEFRRARRLDPSFRQARDRGEQARSLSESGVTAARVSVPGVRAVDAAVAGTLDRINRPLDFITSTVRTTGSPADPAFPSTVATVVIRVTRP